MALAQVEVKVDEKEVNEKLKEILIDYTRPRLLLADIDELKRLTCMSLSSLERHILHDPRVKQYERQLGERGKRYWIYSGVEKAILEIMEEFG